MIVAGIFLVAEGVIRIVRAFGSTGRRWWGVVAGADRRRSSASIILSWPDIGLVTLAVFFAVTMLVRGVLAIVVGFKLRSLLHHPDAPPVQTATLGVSQEPTAREPRSVRRPSPRGESTA